MSDIRDWTRHQAVRAAWLSFFRGKTQSEIASVLGVSQAKVHRLIALAMSEGLIRIEIAERPLECLELEERLSETFKLQSCVVAPFETTKGDTDDDAIEQVAAVGSGVLMQMIEAKKLKQIGVGMGRTIKATIAKLPQIKRSDLELEIVSVSGSLTRKLSANPYDVVQAFSDKVGGEGYFLPVPYFARTAAEKEMFLSQDSVVEMLSKARDSDLFVIGIGSLTDDGHLMSNRMITHQEREELVKAGAVGDLMGRFLTANGELIETELGNHAVGLHFEEVRGAHVLALVAGDTKVDATLAALNSRVITDLVIDQKLGAQVLRAKASKHIRAVK